MKTSSIISNITSSSEVQELTDKFLSKYSPKLEYKTYEYDEKVFRQRERINKMYIVKSGVFKIGQINSANSVDTIGFRFQAEIFSSMAILIPNSQSLFELKSIENNLSSNSMYEISAEQWNDIVEKDEIFKGLPAIAFADNITVAFNLLKLFRKNRKVKEILGNYIQFYTKSP